MISTSMPEAQILDSWQSLLQRPLRSILRKPLALFLVLAFTSTAWLEQGAINQSQAAEMVPQNITGHTRPVTALSWSADGRSLASGSDDRTTKYGTRSLGVSCGPLHGMNTVPRAVL